MMFAVRLFQIALAFAESVAASLIFVHIWICIAYLTDTVGLRIDIFVQTLDDWPGVFEEFVTLSFGMGAVFLLLFHAFKLIVYEKF